MLPPPGSFLQATKNGEITIIQSVLNGLEKLGKIYNVCELYAGSGSITLPLTIKRLSKSVPMKLVMTQ